MTRGPLIVCLAAIAAAPLALEAALGTPLEALAWIGGLVALVALAHLLPRSGPVSFAPARSPPPGPGLGLVDGESLESRGPKPAFAVIGTWATADNNLVDLAAHASARATNSSDEAEPVVRSRDAA